MTVLGLAILFIAALNYVLISISSLTYRAKAVGVHKCNGASGGKIFGMFLLETGIIIAAALLLMTLVLLNFREFFEDTAAAKLSLLLAPERIWVPLTVVGILFMVGGVLPGRLFARIPVSQVFRRYTEGKKGWKRPLLFIQFAVVEFICGLMCVVMVQYQYVLNKEAELTNKGKQTLSDFASGYLYFGLHRTAKGWTFREWAPNATAIYLIGTFNGWQKDN